MREVLTRGEVDAMAFSGMEVIVSQYASRRVETTTRRNWRERLISWPWRPWLAFVKSVRYEPTAFTMNGKLVVHPEYLAAIKLWDRQETGDSR
jgi:hypothetical protein